MMARGGNIPNVYAIAFSTTDRWEKLDSYDIVESDIQTAFLGDFE